MRPVVKVTAKPKKNRPEPKRPGPPAGSRPDAANREVSIDAIDWSRAIRPINADHVERLAGAAQLPAIKVWEVQPGKWLGIDGYHRWRLAKERGDHVVKVILRRFPSGPDGERAFDLECVQSNLQHGLPLTREERDGAIVQIWNRWGAHGGAGVRGETLESLGKLFNLTKQRIHQIVSAPEMEAGAPIGGHLPSGPVAALRERWVLPGGFSTFGRFSSATRRLSRVLEDSDLIHDLLRQRGSEVLDELRQLRSLINVLVGPSG